MGVTNDPLRRLKQHNAILKGGAKYTRAFKGEGLWQYDLRVSNLCRSDALSIESRAKKCKIRASTPIQGRIKALEMTL